MTPRKRRLVIERRPQALVLLSGGLDSMVCCHLLANQKYDLLTMFVDYGQAAKEREQLAAEAVSRHFDSRLTVVTVSSERSFGSGEIPGRNAMLAFVALVSAPMKHGLIIQGIHSGTPYFDCSKEFLSQTGRLIESCTNGLFRLVAPLITWTKADRQLNLCMVDQLPSTRTLTG